LKLYIAEKPSLGRAIAAALSHNLSKAHKNHKTHIELANGDVVSWCVGHILAQADPEDYASTRLNTVTKTPSITDRNRRKYSQSLTVFDNYHSLIN